MTVIYCFGHFFPNLNSIPYPSNITAGTQAFQILCDIFAVVNGCAQSMAELGNSNDSVGVEINQYSV